MPLIPLNIPKGLYRNGTEYMSAGRWRDGNLIRWHEDGLRPIGGWRPRYDNTTASVDLGGTVRGMHAWRDNSGGRFVAFGINDSLSIMNSSGVVTDVTPTGLTEGRVHATANTGWGAASWGDFEWGTERPDLGAILDATVWSLENWGENLLGMSPDDGKLYEYDIIAGGLAAQVVNSPSGCDSMMVTEERFVFCFGAGGNPRLVQWSDREDNTTWTAAATNEAGDIELQTNGRIMQGLRTRGQALIITDQDAHVANYQGPPFVYGFERVGTSCGLISRKAAASVDVGVVWMGLRGFFIYSGGAVNDLPCEVADYVFSDLNKDQRSAISVVVNSQWNEIWWFYPSSTSIENNKYVVFDYAENIWSTGDLERTSGVDRGVFRLPFWIDATGNLYEHEVGFNYDGAAPFAESGPISLGAGENLINVTQVIPDEKTQGDVDLTFKSRFYPNAVEREHGPYSTANPTSVRFQGRQVRMRVDGARSDDWRVGIVRLDVVPGGKR